MTPDRIESLKTEALDATVNSVVITDVSGVVQWVNPAFTRLTGYSSEEAVGQHTRILKSDLTPDSVYDGLWHTIAAGKVWKGRLINKRKDGSHYTEEMTITPIRNELGYVSAFVAVKMDITDLVAAEDARDLAAQESKALADRLAAQLTASLTVVSDMADAVSGTLGKHGRRVADLVLRLLKQVDVDPDGTLAGFDGATANEVLGAALLHDIGKIYDGGGRPHGTDPVTFRYAHVYRGNQLLAPIPGLERVRDLIQQHHEAWDGSGFPGHAAGMQIPLGASVISVVSAFDHALHTRGLSVESALDRVVEESGTRFDPRAVKLLQLALMDTSARAEQDQIALIGVRDLKPGMRLAEPVRTAGGLLLFGSGMTLERRSIERLRTFQDRDPVVDMVRVYRMTAETGPGTE